MRRFISILLLSLFIATGSQAATSPGEYQVKAAYIYNFAKFIHWPDTTFSSKKSPLVIGVLGTDVFNDKLTLLTSKTVRNRPIVIKYFKTLEEIDTCHLLYISPSDKGHTELILKNLGNRPIVTVGEGQRFAQQGGVIQFLKKRERLRFIINLKVAEINSMTIDSQLLSLAVDILR